MKDSRRNLLLFLWTSLFTCICFGIICYFATNLKYNMAFFLKYGSHSSVYWRSILFILLLILCHLVAYILLLKPSTTTHIYDQLPFELNLSLFLLLLFLEIYVLYKLLNYTPLRVATWLTHLFQYLPMIIHSFLLTSSIFLLLLLVLTLLIKQLKCKLIRSTSICYKYYVLLKERKKNRPLIKQLEYLKCHDFILHFLIILYEIISVTWIFYKQLDPFSLVAILLLIVLPLIAEFFLFLKTHFPSKFEKDLILLLNQINNITNQDTIVTNPLEATSLLYKQGERICYLDEVLKMNLEKQIKIEKAKVELITNISHDLKTPLTAMVGYIDLLKKEANLSLEARDYIEGLSRKTTHLNHMLKDLLDLSKITSGTMPVQLTEMDLNKLISQTLIDMDETIIASGFILKTLLAKEPLLFLGDSVKLHRVCQNLIQNALSYALTGSRIFITTTTKENLVTLTIQNTSAYELDFTAEEIVERFVRGDASRRSTGCGLGLAISKSYTELCKGDFHLTLDGDVFKVTLSFNKILNNI